ncbi:MAG TPA: zf-HC2 domain-containing protein [Acidimicrobiia bacterium]|nr:zf-HC2 domain-containing protein [Acidimicrobiia bacterium]
MSPAPPDFGGHLDDVLSAYLDDELAPAARREADAHLAGCADCRADLHEIGSARHAVRILPVRTTFRPLVDPDWEPASAAAHRRRARAAWALAAAVAAAVAMVLPQDPEVAPSLPSMAGSHAARASITGDPLSQLAPIAVPVRFGP